jgi:hypothetical protein
MRTDEEIVGPPNARWSWRTVCAAFALLAVAGCSSLGSRVLPEGTVPDKNDWYGQFYNLENYAKCREEARRRGGGGRNDMGCEFYRLVRVEEPEYWPYPQVPRPKLPEAPNPPVYREGMTSKEYFEALCKAEAGEFIYRTVDNVEGVYQIRPRRLASGDALQDRYVMEDPYGYTEQEAVLPVFMFLRYYATFETKKSRNPGGFSLHPSWSERAPNDEVYERFSAYDERDTSKTKKEFVAKPGSRYGLSWRGITRPHDRELGIAGGELLASEILSGELLGIRRGFARSGDARGRGGFNWETADVCPKLPEFRRNKGLYFSPTFVRKVLKPAPRD